MYDYVKSIQAKESC